MSNDVVLGEVNTLSNGEGQTEIDGKLPFQAGLRVVNEGDGVLGISGIGSSLSGKVYPNGAAPDISSSAVGVYGEGQGSGAGTFGVLGRSADGIGVKGIADGSGTGVSGESMAGNGVEGLSSADFGAGVKGRSSGVNGTGVEGISNIGNGVFGSSDTGDGVNGVSWGSGHGVRGYSVSGEGVVGVSEHGDGIRGFGKEHIGVYGTGVVGVSAEGRIGVLAVGTNDGGGLWSGAGIFFGDVLIGSDFTVVGGIKSVAVPSRDGSHCRLYCMESPECWFEDFGEGKLVKGKAKVKIAPDFTALIRGKYHVFLTPHGDSNGLYLGRQTSRSFEVREQNGGTSSLTFSYRLVARRKDVKAPRLAKVTVPSIKDLKGRFPEVTAPPPQKPKSRLPKG